MDCSLCDRSRLCHRVYRIGGQRMAPAPGVDTCNRFWDCHGRSTLPGPAACPGSWIGRIESFKPRTGKASHSDESYGVRYWPLPFRIAGQRVAISITASGGIRLGRAFRRAKISGIGHRIRESSRMKTAPHQVRGSRSCSYGRSNCLEHFFVGIELEFLHAAFLCFSHLYGFEFSHIFFGHNRFA